MNKAGIFTLISVAIFSTGNIFSLAYINTPLYWVGLAINLVGWIPWGIGTYLFWTKKRVNYHLTIDLDKK